MGSGVSDDDRRSLTAALHTNVDRFADLIADVLQTAGIETATARGVLGELAVAPEELRVAEEELVVQAKPIEQSQRVIDAERERYSALFEYAPDAFVETDDLGAIVEANATAARLLGVTPRVLAGKAIQSFVRPEHRRLVRSRLAALIETGTSQLARVELLPRGGEPVWVEIRWGWYEDQGGGGPHVLWLVRDLTEQMRLEREVDELHGYVNLLTSLAEVSRLVEAEAGAPELLLTRLAELGARTTGADVGLVVADESGQVVARGVAGAAAEAIGSAQLADGGPALDTLRDGEPRTVSGDGLAAWPHLAQHLAEHGVRTLVSCPVPSETATRGVLTLYLRDDRDVGDAVRLLAESASAALANAALYRSAHDLATQLTAALDSRGIIEQAKGILMAADRISPNEAFDLLRRASQRENRKLRSVAESIVQHTRRGEH